MRLRIWFFLTILLLVSCNLPANNTSVPAESPEALGADAIGTAVELTTVARITEAAGSAALPTTAPINTSAATPNPTSCTPLATSTANANVRSGPDIAYDVVGLLSQGGTAKVVGRNEANTWWYIEFAGASSGYAWIAGSVVTTSCLPSVVQVIAAPPLPPTATPTNTKEPEGSGKPDLVASGMQYWPSPAKNAQPISIQVKVTNSGTASAEAFSVVWLSNQDLAGCEWSVSGLNAGASQNLECEFTYDGNETASYWVTLIVDSGGVIEESNEGNNSRDGTVKVAP